LAVDLQQQNHQTLKVMCRGFLLSKI